MRDDLEKKLYEKYPKIFRQKDLPMSDTCMCWGVCVGEGWFNIIDTLCMNMQNHISRKKCTQVEAVQVKEKFGGLRFYYSGGDEYIKGAVDMAEALSYCTCEKCGGFGTQNKTGWIKTLCTSCRSEGGKDG